MTSYILDASAIQSGFEALGFSEELFSTPDVIEEVRNKLIAYNLNLAISLDKIKLENPSEEYVNHVSERARASGDRLSDNDVGLIALALKKKAKGRVRIVTDDYGIQNLSSLLGIEFTPIGAEGIKEVIEWVYYCPACFKKHSPQVDICEVCGTKIKRKKRI
ncbi:MAG: ribonuclease VapC [archaeon]|jgi:UPF0271 protein|nr:ribonuclease VapC [Euryarchaeota archaeon]MDP6527922.1 ribonuclease VapC [Candidatus Paceibacterota bacterium]MDP6704088.1 ribonuclease VapC [archaeon]|tara:strand:- start:64093 stop:64578 length:486 start_codon:yes stop_codon:yes gene_type:complete